MHSRVGLLVCDFDETITQSDSICELASLAYEKRSRTEKCPKNCPPNLSSINNEVKSRTERSLYILSTNWSKDIILGSLFGLENNFDKGKIFSNDLIFDSNNHSIGKLKRRVLCALDKLEIFNQFNKPVGSLSVYIGDSDTDLPCLCEYNIICNFFSP